MTCFLILKLYFIIFYYLFACKCMTLWYSQRVRVYPYGFAFLRPDRQRVFIPRNGVPCETIVLVAKDKVRVLCLLIPHSSSTPLRGTVILFHEEAANRGDMIDSHAIVLSEQGFTVLIAEYRGHGESEGIPSESGLKLDAQAALDFVADHPELSKTPVVVYGHSLGGAVAIDVTSRNADKVSALIIENTYRSIPHLIQKWWPMGRFLGLLCTQKWSSASKIAGMPPSLPILMLSGPRNSVISSEMAELWEVSRMRGKNTGLFKSAASLKQKDEEESPMPPEKDVFEIFVNAPQPSPCPSHRLCGCERPSLAPGMYEQPGYWTAVNRFLDDTVAPPPPPPAIIPSSAL